MRAVVYLLQKLSNESLRSTQPSTFHRMAKMSISFWAE